MSRDKDYFISVDEKGFDQIKIISLLMKADFIFSSDMPYFLDKSTTQTWRYVKDLTENGFTETKLLNRRKYLRLTDKAIQSLKASRDDGYVVHSLFTSNFLASIKKRFPSFTLGWGRDLMKSRDEKNNSVTIVPDAFFDTPSMKRIAVEIELTQKTESRLNQKIEKYLLGGHGFDRVIYFFKDERLLAKFKGLVSERINDLHRKVSGFDTRYANNLFILTNTSVAFRFEDSLPYLYAYEGESWGRDKLINILMEGEKNGIAN